MNVSADLVAFFTLKNRRVKDRELDEDGEYVEEQDGDYEPSPSPRSYNLFSPTVDYFLGIYLSIIVVISVVANLSVIAVMAFRKRKFKSTHIFIVALAISDTLFSIAIHPMLIATSFGMSSTELFGHAGCNWYGFGAVFFGGLSMCIHGTVAFSRYRIIVHSSDDFWHETTPNVYLLIGNIVTAFAIAFAPIVGWGRYETFEYGCTLAFHDPSTNLRSYVISTLIIILVFPLGACCYCYSRIIQFTYQCKLDLFTTVDIDEADSSDMKVDPLQGGFAEHPESKLDMLMKQVDPKLLQAMSLVERKLTRMTLVAALGFMTAWLPFSLLCMWELASPPDEIPNGFRVVACLFAKTATAYNPFIYFFMGKEFRQDCGYVWNKFCRKVTRCKPSCGSLSRSSSGSFDDEASRHKLHHPRLDRSSRLRQAMRAPAPSSCQSVKDDARKAHNGNKKITVNPVDTDELAKSLKSHNSDSPTERHLLERTKSTSSDHMMETVFAGGDEVDAYNNSVVMRKTLASASHGEML